MMKPTIQKFIIVYDMKLIQIGKYIILILQERVKSVPVYSLFLYSW